MIYAEFDFEVLNPKTRRIGFKNKAEAKKAIARIQKGIAAGDVGSEKPDKKHDRISIQILHKIRKTVERNPQIMYREVAKIFDVPAGTLRNNKNVRAIFNKEKGGRKNEAKKRYTNAVFDEKNDHND